MTVAVEEMTKCARIERARARLGRVSRSHQVGLVFPVARLHQYLQQATPFRNVSEGAAVYLAAALEYLCAEMLIITNECARCHHKARITPRHIQLAIQRDEDVRDLLMEVVIPVGGVLPLLHVALLPGYQASSTWTCRFLDN